jgi:flagellar hook-basal body complex protein FliE
LIDRIQQMPAAPISLTAAEKLVPEGPGASQVTKQFSQFLADALDKVNEQQQISNRWNEQFAAGLTSDVHQVLIASEKAALALELTVQIRNKVIESYQEIMRTQL